MLNKLYLLALGLVFIPGFVFAQINSFEGLGDLILNIIDIIVVILISLAGLVFIWQVFLWITADGSKKGEKAKNVAYSLLALFVLFTFWGILNIFVKGSGFGNNQLQGPTVTGGQSVGGGSGLATGPVQSRTN